MAGQAFPRIMKRATELMEELSAPDSSETLESLRLRMGELEATIAAMRSIVMRVAEARMCRDMVSMTESCPHCSLRRSAMDGYSGAHEPDCIVTQARKLGY